jgi:inner membrane protein
MLIAHIPAGYIVSKKFNDIKKEKISFLKYGLIFSIWPDLDLIYFYLIDEKKHLHHMYFPHLPLFLLISFAIIIVIKKLNILKKGENLCYLFLINWFVHLVLDTITGGISWLYPFSKKLYVFIKIPPTYSSWITSFVLHWSFIIEIMITVYSCILLFRQEKKTV